MPNSSCAVIRESLVRDIAAEMLELDSVELGGWDFVKSYVHEHWEEYFAGIPESDIVAEFAPDSFRVLDWVETVNYRNADVVPALAKGAVTEGVYYTLTEYEEAIECAALLHNAFETLCTDGGDDAPYTTADGWPNPSLLVTEFFTWLGEQDSAGTEWAREANERLGFAEFNESHVRRLTVIDPIGDAYPPAEAESQASVLVDALWEWVEAAHTAPDTL